MGSPIPVEQVSSNNFGGKDFYTLSGKYMLSQSLSSRNMHMFSFDNEIYLRNLVLLIVLPSGASGKELSWQYRRRDAGSIPTSRRSPGGGHSNPLHYSCLEDPTDRGAWRSTIHSVAKS